MKIKTRLDDLDVLTIGLLLVWVGTTLTFGFGPGLIVAGTLLIALSFVLGRVA